MRRLAAIPSAGGWCETSWTFSPILGFRHERFIWIHAQAEEDFAFNLEMAQRGAWIEYDNLGWEPEKEAALIERIQSLIAAGLVGRILLSHDMGWYTPAETGGGTPQPFTYLTQYLRAQASRCRDQYSAYPPDDSHESILCFCPSLNLFSQSSSPW